MPHDRAPDAWAPTNWRAPLADAAVALDPSALECGVSYHIPLRATAAFDHGKKESLPPSAKPSKICGECRRQRLHCDFLERELELSRPGHGTAVSCTQCKKRGSACDPVHVSPNRYYPRPSRTGRRIELGRQLHGSADYGNMDARATAASAVLNKDLEMSWPRVYLRLLNCYFSYAFSSAPVIEYERFAQAFNRSYGDLGMMSRLFNGQEGDEATRAYFLERRVHLVTQDNAPKDESSPETLQVLLTAMCAWGMRFIHLPFESLDIESLENLGSQSLISAVRLDPCLGFRRAALVEPPSSGQKPATKPRKRRQGVACDTCRLRRVRCDLMEQPPGVNVCTRCRVKRVVCTDRYIRWKRERDLQKRPNEARPLPDVQLLPLREEFEPREELPLSVLGLSQQELLEIGHTREAACNYLVNRVLMLIHKYDLVHRCTTESVCSMILLMLLLDHARPQMAAASQQVAVSHLQRLYQRGEFNLGCLSHEMSIDDLFNRLSAMRLLQTAWSRDAIASVMYQKPPAMPADWFVAGYRTHADGSLVAAPVVDIAKLARSVSPPMTLAVLFLLPQQLGVVAHNISRRVQLPTMEMTQPPTLEYLRDLTQVCHEIWDQLLAVEEALHVSMCQSRPHLSAALPIFGIKWAGMVVMLLFVTYRAVCGRLGEWMSSMRTSLCPSRVDAIEVPMDVMIDLQDLYQTSRARTLAIARVGAYYCHAMLPTCTFFRGSSMSRLLFRMAQLLSRANPVVDDCGDTFEPDLPSMKASLSTPSTPLVALLNPTSGEEMPRPPSKPIHRVSPLESALLQSVPLSTELVPFTAQAKQQEVHWMIEALGHMGFAYPGMGTEIRRIVDILHANR